MTLLTVVHDVCGTVGVHAPTTVFGNILADRTMLEMVKTANEAAAQISADTRDWTLLRKTTGPTTMPAPFQGDGIKEAFDLPIDYRRMLTKSEVWLSNNTLQPATFIPETDDWLQRRAANTTTSWGEWTIYGGQMHIWPIMGTGVSARFSYLDKNFIENRTSTGALIGLSQRFASDADTFRLDERLLTLGMIWLWKSHKGSPYAEDLGTFSNAMATAMGADSPAPIIIGTTPISASARVAYPWPVPT